MGTSVGGLGDEVLLSVLVRMGPSLSCESRFTLSVIHGSGDYGGPDPCPVFVGRGGDRVVFFYGIRFHLGVEVPPDPGERDRGK